MLKEAFNYLIFLINLCYKASGIIKINILCYFLIDLIYNNSSKHFYAQIAIRAKDQIGASI